MDYTMDESEMLDLYEELVETLQQLNKEAPKIKELYDNSQKELEQARSALQNVLSHAKEELTKAETAGTKKIADLSTERKKQIDEQIKTLDDVVLRAANLQKVLGVSSDTAQKINEQISGLSQKLSLIEESVDGQKARFSKLEKRIGVLETAFFAPNPLMEIDYSELAPGIDLYNKYNGRIGRPVVLEKPNYTKDYCFRVSGVDEEQGVLIGRYYQMGKLYGNKTTFNYSYPYCRMFNGDTLDEVISGEI